VQYTKFEQPPIGGAIHSDCLSFGEQKNHNFQHFQPKGFLKSEYIFD